MADCGCETSSLTLIELMWLIAGCPCVVDQSCPQEEEEGEDGIGNIFVIDPAELLSPKKTKKGGAWCEGWSDDMQSQQGIGTVG